ncbi:MAG: LuxR C-terminal-related transcriptional regulator [Nitrospiria bacterium]
MQKPPLPAILNTLSKTSEGMFVVDSDGKVFDWNASAEKTLGYRAEEVIGRPCYEILCQRDPFGNVFCHSHCTVITMAKQGRLIRNYETQGVTKGNRKIRLNTRILLVSSQSATEPLIVHLFRLIAPPDTGTPSPERNDEGLTSSFSAPPELSPREKEVLVLLSRCQVAKEIAATLEISNDTARTHIQHILQKLNAHSKLEALMIAAQHGLI